MSLADRISPSKNGYYVLMLPGLGEIHLECLSRPDLENSSTLWEGKVRYKDKELGSLCTILHIIADSPEDLLYQLDQALFIKPEPA
jgi:hypothetical protein